MGIANSTLSETPVTRAQRRVHRVGVQTFWEGRIPVGAILLSELSIARTVGVRNPTANDYRVGKLRFHRDLAGGTRDFVWMVFYSGGEASFASCVRMVFSMQLKVVMRVERWFNYGSGVILLVAALAKVWSEIGPARALDGADLIIRAPFL